MAVRGTAGFLIILPQIHASQSSGLYYFQNYFPDPTNDGIFTYDYKAFSTSALVADKNSTSSDFTLTFPATAENVDLVEACLTNRYKVLLLLQQWSAVEGLEAPSSFTPYAFTEGDAVSAIADTTTISLVCRPYADAIDSDIPWRKIPWTILGPLSLGA